MATDASDRDVLAARLERIVGLLRTTPRYRLRAAVAGRFESRVAAGRALAAALALAAQGIEGAAAEEMPAWRALPALPDLAVGDQIAVTAHDYLEVVGGAAATVWTPSGRVALGVVQGGVEAIVEEVGALW